MKVGGSVIRDSQITQNDSGTFIARYNNHSIEITDDHELGDPIYDHLIRFSIDVFSIKSGSLVVNTYEDLHTMNDAIVFALKGAMLGIYKEKKKL